MTTPTIADLIDALAPITSPKLTWYGAQAERIELSGRVLTNWVIKTTNLMVEELDLDTCDVVNLALPTHWRKVVFTFATWLLGAKLSQSLPPDLEVTTTPLDSQAPQILAVALPALARSFLHDLGQASDYCATVLGLGDDLGWVNAPSALDIAIQEPLEITYGQLIEAAKSRANEIGIRDGDRVLIAVPWAWDPLDILACYVGGGSTVLVGDQKLNLDTLTRQEHISFRL